MPMSTSEFNELMALEPLAEFQREMLQQVAHWAEGPDFRLDPSGPRDRIYFAQTPLNPNSVASRIVNDADRLTWGDLYGGLRNGEPLTPATCHTCGAVGPCVPRPCGARECTSQVCVDLCVECVGQAANSYARPGIRPDFVAIDDVDYAAPPFGSYSVRTVPAEEATRPDHYRVRPGQCACGFRSIFTGTMQAHLAPATT